MSDLDNVDDILDMTLDDLEDMPTFEPYPAGVHKALVSFSVKDINGAQAVIVDCKMVETIELANPTTDSAPEAGSESNMMCMLGNEFGRGAFKAVSTPVGLALGIANIRELIEATTDIECIIFTTLRPKKDDPDTKYLNIKELQVV